MPLVTVVLACGNGTSPLDQTIVGGGKPKAWQETEASEFGVILITLSGVSMNRGGTELITERSESKYQTRHIIVH